MLVIAANFAWEIGAKIANFEAPSVILPINILLNPWKGSPGQMIFGGNFHMKNEFYADIAIQKTEILPSSRPMKVYLWTPGHTRQLYHGGN